MVNELSQTQINLLKEIFDYEYSKWLETSGHDNTHNNLDFFSFEIFPKIDLVARYFWGDKQNDKRN